MELNVATMQVEVVSIIKTLLQQSKSRAPLGLITDAVGYITRDTFRMGCFFNSTGRMT